MPSTQWWVTGAGDRRRPPLSARRACRTGPWCRGRTGTARRVAGGARRAARRACPAGAADRRSSTTPATVSGGGSPSAPAATIEQIRPPIDRPPTTTRAPSDGGQLVAHRGHQHGRAVGRPAPRLAVREVGPHGRPRRRRGPFDGDERRLITAGPGTGEQQQRRATSARHEWRGVGEDLAGLGQLEHGRAGDALVAAVVGVHGAHLGPELGRDLLLRRRRRARREAEDVQRPGPRVGERRQRRRVGAGEVGDQRRADRAAPAHRLVQHRGDDVAARRGRGARRRRSPRAPGRSPVPGRVEVEAELLAVAEQPVRRQRPSPWRSTWKRWRRRGWTTRSSRLDLVDQAVDVGDEVVVDVVDVARRRRRRAAARRSRAPGRRAARGGRARRAASAPAGGCATPPARPGASAQYRRPSDVRRRTQRAQRRWRRRRSTSGRRPARRRRSQRRPGESDSAASTTPCARRPWPTRRTADGPGRARPTSTASVLAADRVVGVLGQAVGGENSVSTARPPGRPPRPAAGSTSVPCSMASSSSSTVGSASVATMTVVPSQRCGTSASTSAWVSVWRSPGGHSSSPNSTPGVVVGEGDRERAEHLLEAVEQVVGVGLQLLGHDELVAVPDVGDVGLGERLGQLGTLVERPRRHVVVHLDGVRIVGVPVEHEPDATAAHGPTRRPRPLRLRPCRRPRRRPDRNLAMELVRVTEAAALAASRWIGRGDKNGADGAAVDAMRTVLSTVPMDGIVVIGEGEKDDAPMLFNGEQRRRRHAAARRRRRRPDRRHHAHRPGPRQRPVGDRRERARGRCSTPARRLHGEDRRRARAPSGRSTSPPRRRRTCAGSPRPRARAVRDLTVVILDRPRHAELIDEVRGSRRPHPPDHRRRRLRRRSPPASAGSRRRRAVRHRRHARGRHRRRRAEVHGRRDPGPAVAPRRRRAGGDRGRRATTSTRCSPPTTSCAATTASSPPPASPTASCSTACASTPAASTHAEPRDALAQRHRAAHRRPPPARQAAGVLRRRLLR